MDPILSNGGECLLSYSFLVHIAVCLFGDFSRTDASEIAWMLGGLWRMVSSMSSLFFAVMARPINIVSWNVRGLGDTSKRCAIFTYLRQFYPAMVCLPETYLKDKTHFLRKPWFSHSYYSVYSSHARGIAILVHRQLPFQCLNSVVDPQSRYVCLLCSIYNFTIILVAVYVPLPYSGEVLKKLGCVPQHFIPPYWRF